jgi:acetyl esterase
MGVWSRDAERVVLDQYVPNVTDRRYSDASPLQTRQFANLPPAVILTAEYDVLRDEGEAYKERLRAAGVPLRHGRFTGQVHGFFIRVNILRCSAAGCAFVVDAVAEQLANADSRNEAVREDDGMAAKQCS